MATKARDLALAASNVDSSGNINADTVDLLDSSQFTRSDQTDTVNGSLTLNGGMTVRNSDYENALKLNRNLDVASVGAAGIKLKFGAINNGSDVYPVEIVGVVDTDGGAGWVDINLDGSNKLKIHNSGTVTASSFSGDGSALTNVSTAAEGVFYENSQTLNNSYTITSGKSAMSAGPVTLASGVTATIPSGSRWVIV